MNPAPLIVAVVVLFRPPEKVERQVERMIGGGLPMVAVYNQSDPQVAARLRATGARVIEHPQNLGLAEALNAGITEALAMGAQNVILFDQDSEPAPELASNLLVVMDKARSAGLRVAAIGPTPADIKGSKAAPDGCRDHSNPVEIGDQGWREVPTVISSGCLIPAEAIEGVGLMWADLFIDDIDHEWCLRARYLGWTILQATAVRMPHDLGDVGIEVFGRFKAIHRSPVRHFYIIRNTLVLLRFNRIGLTWRMAEGLKTLYRIPVYLVASQDKKETAKAVFRALVDHARVYHSRPDVWK